MFLDETAAATKMARRHGRALCGECSRVVVAFGHWKTIAGLAGLRPSGLTASALVDGPTTGARFRDYVEHTLAIRLQARDTAALDILPAQ